MVTINEDRPDLVVGVDFGMTFTGKLAYPDHLFL
jgi:hypothetical protein